MSKETKLLLKEIKEAIKNKKNDEAIKKCEQFLKTEPDNYMGLILMGAAYQDKSKREAAKFLKRAVEVAKDVDPTVALQGLSNCAEVEELPNIYRKLLVLVPDKFQDYHEKILNITNTNNFIECCDILKSEISIENNDTNIIRRESALLTLGKIFTKTKQLIEDDEKICIISALEKVLYSDCDSLTKLDCYKLYFKQLYKMNNFEKLLEKAREMLETYPDTTNTFEWICQIYSTQHMNINMEKLTGHSINFYADKLLAINENNSLAMFVKAIMLFENEKYVQARDVFLQIKNSSNAMKEFLARTYLKIGAYGLAENIYRDLKVTYLEFGISLCYSEDDSVVKESIPILENFIDKEEALFCLGRAYFKSKIEDKVKEIFEKIEKIASKELVQMYQIDYMVTPEAGINILSETSDFTFELEFRKGKLYLELKEYEKSLDSLLKSTKTKPYFADCFLYLGLNYYNRNDFIRAKKCLEKCLNFNPCSELGLKYLCALYKKNQENELNALTLISLVNQLQGRQLKSVCFQQGLNYLEMNKPEKAIEPLRSAIRFDLGNILYWETLGDAYHQKGSYLSALKVYQKILENKPDHKYAKLQVGIIKGVMHMYNESIECLTELLSEHNDYFPALKGIAEAYYSLANHSLKQRLLGRCKDNLQLAVDHLQKVFLNNENKHFIWLWRLTASIFVSVACLPTRLAFLKVNGVLVKKENEGEVHLYRKELFDLAIKFYMCALKLNEKNAYIWQELSVCAYNYILHEQTADKSKILQLAKQACKRSIENDSKRCQTWNVLGVLHALKFDDIKPNYSLAQHYFIKALHLDNNSAITWANLGVLYLNVNEIKLANKAFTRSQESDLSYVNCWIGQAMIAEICGETEEAMDLFRHCTELDFHSESALSYSFWVCSILSDEEKMKQKRYQYVIHDLHSIPQSSDSITWYVGAEDDKASVEALSYWGYLSAIQKLWSTAIKAYKLAVEKAVDSKQKDKLLFNLGFCYLNGDKPKLAAKTFASLTEATFKSTFGLALSYRNCGDYEKSYEMYNSALEWLASSDNEKGQILVAMSSILYLSQEVEDTKSVIYQCLDLENRPIEALFSACALGIIHLDMQLAELVIDELKKFENDIEYCHHIAFLTSQYLYAKKQSKVAYYYLISKVHCYPDRPKLRKVLADFLINYMSKTRKYSIGTCQIAQSVIDLGHRSSIRNDSLETAKALLTASEAMKNVDKIKQKKLIQKAIHVHPDFKLAWNALVSIK